jgi:hypothetical protein
MNNVTLLSPVANLWLGERAFDVKMLCYSINKYCSACKPISTNLMRGEGARVGTGGWMLLLVMFVPLSLEETHLETIKRQEKKNSLTRFN